MGVLSKLADSLNVPIVTYECREVTHVWRPGCFAAVAECVPLSFLFCIKTYGTLYIITALLKLRQTGRINVKNLVKSILRSSAFLTLNMAAYLYFTCVLRRLFGFYFFGTFYIAGFFGSLLAILLEQKKRQTMLTLYLTNLASESLFLQLKNRGYVRTIQNGETVLFGIGLAALMYFKEKGVFSDIHSALKITHSLDYKSREIIKSKSLPIPFRRFLETIRSKYRSTPRCEHKNSCLSSIFERTLKNFGIGLVISSFLSIFQSLQTPAKLISKLFNRQNLRLPLFAASLPFIYHITNCGMNRFMNIEKPIQSAICGAFSSLAMLFYSSSTIAMYVLWKAIEQCYNRLNEKGLIPSIKYGKVLLYSISTSIVIGNIIIEPHAVRKGYYNFINSLTSNKVNLFNRLLLDPLGFRSSRFFFWDYVHFIHMQFA